MSVLIEVEELHGKSPQDVSQDTGIPIDRYNTLRKDTSLITTQEVEQLSLYFKVPKSLFMALPQFYHQGKDNSFGPIYKNSNFYFASIETEDIIKKIFEANKE